MAGVTDVIPQYNQGFEQGAEAHIKYRLCNSAEVMLTQLSHGADKGYFFLNISLYNLLQIFVTAQIIKIYDSCSYQYIHRLIDLPYI